MLFGFFHTRRRRFVRSAWLAGYTGCPASGTRAAETESMYVRTYEAEENPGGRHSRFSRGESAPAVTNSEWPTASTFSFDEWQCPRPYGVPNRYDLRKAAVRSGGSRCGPPSLVISRALILLVLLSKSWRMSLPLTSCSQATQH